MPDSKVERGGKGDPSEVGQEQQSCLRVDGMYRGRIVL